MSLWGIVFVRKNCHIEAFLPRKTSTKEKYRNSDINTIPRNYINYTTQLTEQGDGNKKELYGLDRLVSVFKRDSRSKRAASQ